MTDRYDYTHAERKERIIRICVSIGIWVATVAAMIALAWVVVHFSIEKTTVVDASMEPTLEQNDRIVIDTLSYRIRSPRRNEVIVFRQGDGEHDFYNIKRVIGLPGETVRIAEGVVYINGKAIPEFAKVDTMILPGLANYEIALGEDEYFVLGDNRNLSEESRYSNIGLVSGNDIIGKVVFRIKPELAIVDKLNLNSKLSGGEETK